MDFYDEIADDYEDIVNGTERIDAADRFAAWLIEAHDVRRALDVACGTGLYAKALARQGTRVVAADISAGMIERARAAGDDDIKWICSPMETIATETTGPFDAILCMGNSLPHLLTDEQLRATLAGFANLLAPGGVAILQLLNYDRVLARAERFVGATRTRNGDREYIRFYDFEPDRVQFNLLELRWQGLKCEYQLHQTTLRPYRPAELRAAVLAAGLAEPTSFDGLQRRPFDESQSQGILLTAHRPASA